MVLKSTTTAIHVPRFAELFITLVVQYPAIIFFSVEYKVNASRSMSVQILVE
jgi:hypothetical protein